MQFSDPDALALLDTYGDAQLDALPFGVVALDEGGIVLAYNAQESEKSGHDRQHPGSRPGRGDDGAFGVAKPPGVAGKPPPAPRRCETPEMGGPRVGVLARQLRPLEGVRREAPMALEAYCSSRLVVLKPGTPAAEAVRAMTEQGIGTVLVARRGRLLGLATDRDLAIQVVGRDRDPHTTPIGDVMCTDVATVGPHASIDEVLWTMREHACRRVPVVDVEGGLLGLVTLDDLILDGHIDGTESAAVLRAQLGEPRWRRRAPSVVRAARSAARAENTYRQLVSEVARRTDLTPARAEMAMRIVVGSICRRIRPQEGAQLVAQLPSILRDTVVQDLQGPDRTVSRGAIERQLEEILPITPRRAPEVLRSIAQLLAERVSEGEMDQVTHQLPADLRAVFPARGIEAQA